MDLWTILRDVVLLLGASLILGGVCLRLRQSPLLGYLLAGMVLGGPGSLALVQSENEIEAIAELGVALLLYSLGLEFSLERLRSLGAKPLWGGAAQVLLTMALGALIAKSFGVPTNSAVAFGAMIALSSTAVVLRILLERTELDAPHGRNSLAVLLTQDLAVVPLALLLTLLGSDGDWRSVTLNIAWLLLGAATLVTALWGVNRAALATLGAVALRKNRELTVLLAVVLGLGASWAAHAVGVSPAMGAFISGMLLGSSPFATQIRADVSSLRVVLLTLFFGSAGMLADPLWMARHLPAVVGVCLLVTAVKGAIVWIVFRALGHPTRVAASTGLCLAQVGEFAFVLAAIGRSNGVVDGDLHALVISVTILSLGISAVLVPNSARLGDWLAKLQSGASPPAWSPSSGRQPDALIIGFGPVGQLAAAPLLDQGLNVTILDLNPANVQRASEQGFQAALGDATHYEILEHLEVQHCRLIVITIPHHQAALQALQNVRGLAPHALFLVRSRYRLTTAEFATQGATVLGDEENVGQALAQEVRRWRRRQTAENQQSAR